MLCPQFAHDGFLVTIATHTAMEISSLPAFKEFARIKANATLEIEESAFLLANSFRGYCLLPVIDTLDVIDSRR